MSNTVDEEYFNTDYSLQPVWMGLLWVVLQWSGWIYVCNSVGWSNLSSPVDYLTVAYKMNTGIWGQHAWNIIVHGHFWVFLGLFVTWLLAYIQ